jgi:hypothetical protein
MLKSTQQIFLRLLSDRQLFTSLPSHSSRITSSITTLCHRLILRTPRRLVFYNSGHLEDLSESQKGSRPISGRSVSREV